MRHVWPAVLALVVLFATSFSSSACFSPETPPGPIKDFRAEREKVTKGKTDKLIAEFEGLGTIDNGIGEVQSGAAIETPPLTGTTSYTLTVTTEAGETATKTVTIPTVDPAVITSFKADKVIRPNEQGSITAVFSGGPGVVDGGIGPVTSGVSKSVGVVPATKNYTLTVTNEIGDPVTAVAEVEAAVTPVISSFTAPGAVVSRFLPTMLTAAFTGGKGAVDQGVGPIAANMATKTPDVPPEGATYTLTVTNGLGEAVSKTLTVATKKELWVVDYAADVLVYDADSVGDVDPKRAIITIDDPTLTGLFGVVVANKELYLGSENGTPSITSYGIGDGQPGTGAIPIETPVKRRISGAMTTWAMGTYGPNMFSVSATEIFVADKSDSIKVFNIGDTGNIAPKRTIGGAGVHDALATWVDGAELYVSNFNNGAVGGGTVSVYPTSASGTPAPTRTFTVTDEPTGIIVSGAELFVVAKHEAGSEITVYNKMTGAQLRKISGPLTQLGKEVYQCSIADGFLYCPSYQGNKVLVFPVTATGNVAPTRFIGGPKTYIDSPSCAFVF